jgi:hypothetical protein
MHNDEVLRILSSLEIVADVKSPSGLHVRIFRTTAAGECDPGNEAKTCPRAQLLFVAGLDEEGLASAHLWETAKLIGWEVRETSVVPKSERREASQMQSPSVTVEADVCRAPGAVESGASPAVGGAKASFKTWWRKMTYDITVSFDKIAITQSGPGGDYCNLY